MCVTFFCLYPNLHKNKQEYNQHQKQEQRMKNQQNGSQNKYKYHKKNNNQININDQHKHKKIKKNKKVYNKQQDKQQQDRADNQQKLQQITITKNATQNTTNITNIPNQSNQHSTHTNSIIKFIIAFNRDQQSYRQTLKMNAFEQDPNIYAGRDLKSTGTWLGINIKTAIMVVLTNYDLPVFRPGKSRGQLVKSFLLTQFISSDILNSQNINQPHIQEQIDNKIKQKLINVLKQCQLYSAFNLMIYNIRNNHIFYICSQLNMKQPIILQRNIMYGLCNTDLFTLWPKTKYGLSIFQNIVKNIKYQYQNDQQILNQLVEKVMKDKKRFSQNLNDQAAVFLQPFYSTLENAQRMTKSTFVAIIKQYQIKDNDGKINKKTQLIMREITHKNNNYKPDSKNTKHTRSNPNPKLNSNLIKSQKSSGINNQYQFDHIEEKIVNYRLLL